MIDYFKIEGIPGGCQDWFADYWMHVGGCSVLAACDIAICLAGNLGFADCCPHDPHNMTKAGYIEFGIQMKSYIRPRIGGVTKTGIFTKGFGRYLRDCGYKAEFAVCGGEEDYVKACRFVKAALNRNLPIAYLMLRHKDNAFKNISWHWFMITGYEIKKERMLLQYHTYGGVYKVDFERMWHTGRHFKGGMVAVSRLVKT